MTRKEAIKCLKDIKARCERLSVSGKTESRFWLEHAEAVKLAIAALHPINREQVEKVWRGEWEGVPRLGVYDMACSKCGYSPGIRFYSSDFCPNCGAPMTDKAVDMMLERWKKAVVDEA